MAAPEPDGEPPPPVQEWALREAAASFPIATGVGMDNVSPRALLRLSSGALLALLSLFHAFESLGGWARALDLVRSREPMRSLRSSHAASDPAVSDLGMGWSTSVLLIRPPSLRKSIVSPAVTSDVANTVTVTLAKLMIFFRRVDLLLRVKVGEDSMMASS